MTWAWLFRSRIGQGLLVAWAAVVGLAAIWFGGRNSAKSDIKRKEAEDAVEGHEVRNEVENAVARDRNARERLRSEWSE